jgi:tetratricopeptide (TPR) repeat protein
MKKLIAIGTFLVLSAVVIYSCSDEFLEIPTQNALSQDNLTDASGIDAALIATYSMLDGWNGNGNPWGGAQSNYLWGDIMSDDAYKGSEPTDFPDWEVLEKLTWQATHGELNNKFLSDYEGISRANAAINLATDGDLGDADRDRIIGEARMLRGHFHFDLYKVFKNVPYYSETDTDFKKPNTDGSGNYVDILPDIIADFEAAAASLPASQAEVGRVTQASAYAYLGKAYVWAGQWAQAKAALDNVVDASAYGFQNCYHEPFSVSTENGGEGLLTYQATVNDGTGGGENGNHLERLTFAHGGSPFGCCGVRQPSQNLVNAYKVDANGLPLFDTFNDADLTAADPVDPRLDWVVAREGVPLLNYDIPYTTGWVRSPAYGGPYSNKKVMYEQGKGEGSTVGWVGTQLSALNVHLLRYADAVLLLAEAEAQLGNLARATELVNQVRQRAGNCAQGPATGFAVPIDDASITWATYSVGTYTSDFADLATAMQAIRWERRLELAMEGHRFFDLRRWGIAEATMNEYLAVEQTKRAYLTGYESYDPAKHSLYPLPSVQIELSSVAGEPQLKQNPGW